MSDIEQLKDEELDSVIEGQAIPSEPEGSDESEKQENTPMPMAIKLLMLGLGLFVLVSICGAVWFAGKRKEDAAQKAKEAAQQSVVQSNNSVSKPGVDDSAGVDFLINNSRQSPPQINVKDDPVGSSVSSIDKKIYAEEIASNVAKNVKQELSAELETQNKQILANKEQLQQLSGNVVSMQSGISKADSTALTEITSLKGNIKLLSEQIVLLEKKLDKSVAMSGVETAAAKKRIHALEERLKADPAAPPFELLSVDEWGTEKQAVLMLDGYTTVAGKGEIRAGWQIVSLSNTEIECQRLKDGRLYILKRKGGAQ